MHDDKQLKDEERVGTTVAPTAFETTMAKPRGYTEKQQRAEVQPTQSSQRVQTSSRSNRHTERSGDFSFTPIVTWPKPPITHQQALYFANSYYDRFDEMLDLDEAAERLAHGREMFLLLQGEDWIELNIGRSIDETGSDVSQ